MALLKVVAEPFRALTLPGLNMSNDELRLTLFNSDGLKSPDRLDISLSTGAEVRAIVAAVSPLLGCAFAD